MVMPFKLILSSKHLHFQNMQCFIMAMPPKIIILYVIVYIYSRVILPNKPYCIYMYIISLQRFFIYVNKISIYLSLSK